MIWLIFCKSVVAQTCGNHLIIFPPQQRMLASHLGAAPLGSGCEHVGSGSRGRAEHQVWQAADPRICSSILSDGWLGATPLGSGGCDGVRRDARAAEGTLKQEPNTKRVLGTRLVTSRSTDLFEHS